MFGSLMGESLAMGYMMGSGRTVSPVKKWKNKESKLKCEVVKHEWGSGGHYCGYVYFDKLEWMKDWDMDDFNEFISIHGGITYADKPEDSDKFCIGFDTMHSDDFVNILSGETIWSDESAICETNHLAIQVGRLLEKNDE